MRRVLAVAIVLVTLAPCASAAPEDEYPAAFVALLPGWIRSAEGLANGSDHAAPWWPQAQAFLDKAHAAADAGRFRVATFHVETFTEVVLANKLMDESQSLGSDAERRAFIATRTSAWNQDAEDAWRAYRAKLHRYDGELHSLQTLELAVYSADMALGGATGAGDHAPYAREFPKQEGVPDGYVLALVRASHTSLQTLRWADRMLDEALSMEGVPPRVNDTAWAEIGQVAIASAPDGQEAERLGEIAAPARANNESMLAIASWLAEQRVMRAGGMQTIFGDAGTRGLDVVNDAARGMNKQLNNTTLEDAHDRSLLGVFTVDAIDRARFTNEFIANGTADLGTVIVAWSALEHQAYATAAFGYASPTPPSADPSSANATDHPVGKWWDGYRYRAGEPGIDYYLAARVESKDAPGLAVVALLGALAFVAFARRRL